MVGWARSHRLGWAAEEMRKLIFSFLLFRACGSSMKEGVSRDPSSDLRAILLISRSTDKRLVEQRWVGQNRIETSIKRKREATESAIKILFYGLFITQCWRKFFFPSCYSTWARARQIPLKPQMLRKAMEINCVCLHFWGEKIRSKWIIIGTIVRKKKKTYCHKYISFVRQVTQREKKLPQKKCSSQRQLGGKRETSQRDRFLLLDSKSHNTINGGNFCLPEESYPDVPANVSILRSNF